MIKIVPDRIPQFQLESYGVDDWAVLCEGRVLVRGLSEYVARMFAAAPKILELLEKMSRREHAPARIPIETLLKSLEIEFWRPSDAGSDNDTNPL